MRREPMPPIPMPTRVCHRCGDETSGWYCPSCEVKVLQGIEERLARVQRYIEAQEAKQV